MRLTPEQQELAMTCYPMAWRLARKYGFGQYHSGNRYDAVSQAMYGLLTAVRSYDPAKGKFRTLAYMSIVRSLLDMRRAAYIREGRGEVPLEIDVAYDFRGFAEVDARDEAEYVRRHCTDDEWDLLDMRYLRETSYDAAAAAMGITSNAAMKRILTLNRKLQKQLGAS